MKSNIDFKCFLLIASSDNPSPWDKLIALKEDGPGFQLIETDWSNDESSIPGGKYIVFNCELFVEFCLDDDVDNIAFESCKSYEEYIHETMPTHCTSVENPISLSDSNTYTLSTLILSTYTCELERYWRLSAYANGRRINFQNEVVANTYLTSDSELAHISSGFGAVGRYALPNPFPSIYAYSVVPDRGLTIRLGTVRPAFGQSGGGVEVVILQPSGKYSVSNHKKVLPSW